MKCLVCKKEFEGSNACPRCHYKAAVLLGDINTAMHEEEKRAVQFRKELIAQVRVEVSGYLYEFDEKEEKYKLAKEEKHSLGSGSELVTEERWLSKPINKLEDQKEINVNYSVLYANKVHHKSCDFSCETTEDTVFFGVKLNEEFMLQLMLKDSSNILCTKTVDVLAL